MEKFLKFDFSDKQENEKRREIMKAYGFYPDFEYNCYIKRGYGAFIGNIIYINSSIERFNDLIEKGYTLLLGPEAPNDNGLITNKLVGVYCSNYKQVIDEERDKSMLLNL